MQQQGRCDLHEHQAITQSLAGEALRLVDVYRPLAPKQELQKRLSSGKRSNAHRAICLQPTRNTQRRTGEQKPWASLCESLLNVIMDRDDRIPQALQLDIALANGTSQRLVRPFAVRHPRKNAVVMRFKCTWAWVDPGVGRVVGGFVSKADEAASGRVGGLGGDGLDSVGGQRRWRGRAVGHVD